MKTMSESVVSTTTQMDLNPGTRRRPVSGGQHPPRSTSRPSSKEVELLEQNAAMSQRLIEVLNKQIKSLEAEIMRLRESLREASRCNVLLFCSDRDLSVAAVTNGTADGVALFSRVHDMFSSKRQQLHKRGVGFAVIEDVPVNQLHDTPFSGGR